MNINFDIPEKLSLANFPTRIEKLERLTKELSGPNIYIKRDDQTGMEWSGNKIRKLEYSVKEALNKGCNYLITCGGSQSNHCRATAAVAAKLGLKCCLVLRGSIDSPVEGNLFLDKLLGAETKFITSEEYSSRRNEIMKEIALDKENAGHKPYIIPEGASNGIGSFGYYNAMLEIIKQEKEMNLPISIAQPWVHATRKIWRFVVISMRAWSDISRLHRHRVVVCRGPVTRRAIQLVPFAPVI